MHYAADAPCPYCNLEGYIHSTETCPRCQGRGRVASAFAVHVCTKCLGTGVIQTVLVCGHCYGRQITSNLLETLGDQASPPPRSAGSAKPT